MIFHLTRILDSDIAAELFSLESLSVINLPGSTFLLSRMFLSSFDPTTEPRLKPERIERLKNLYNKLKENKDVNGSEQSIKGHLVLGLYYDQLLNFNETLLDISSGALRYKRIHSEIPLTWNPGGLYHNWDIGFLTGIRSIYTGIFLNRPRQLKRGLEQLELTGAEEIFRNFVGEDHKSTTFHRSHLSKSMRELINYMKQNNIQAYPDFFAFAVYLGCLYNNLQFQIEPLNNKLMFEMVTK